MYLQACHALGIVPVSAFIRHLQSATVDLKHHGIGPKGAKAIGIAMTVGILCVRTYITYTCSTHVVHMVCTVHTVCIVFIIQIHVRSIHDAYSTYVYTMHTMHSVCSVNSPCKYMHVCVF